MYIHCSLHWFVLVKLRRAELRWILIMVESNFSFKSADSMVQLLCLLDKESKILPKMTLSRTKCGYYLQGPARVDIESSRSEKWNENLFHCFREVKWKSDLLFSRSEKWNENSLMRSRSEISREFSLFPSTTLLENLVFPCRFRTNLCSKLPISYSTSKKLPTRISI